MADDLTTIPDLDNQELERVGETQDPPPQAPSLNSPVLPSANKKLFTVLKLVAFLLLSITIIGVLYRTFFRPTSPAEQVPAPSAAASPSASPAHSGETKLLRLSQLGIPYPANWLIFFSPVTESTDPHRTVYFARNLEEYRRFASCASTGSCTAAPLALAYTGQTSIWTGYSLTDFLRETQPSIPLDRLTSATLGEYPALVGYTDLSETRYQVIFQKDSSTYQSLILTAREDTLEMLTAMQENLPQLTLLPSNSEHEPKQLANSRAFTLRLSARLTTGEFFVLETVLANLFPPNDQNLNPHYLLFVEGTSAYPTTNILDHSYLLLTDNPDLSPGMYSLPQIDAVITDPPIEKMVSYLEDPKYCEQASDCIYRANFCEIDAYNAYHQFFTPWGCGPAEYRGVGNSVDLQAELNCRLNEQIEVIPESVACQDNQCVAINPTAACVKKP